jgi:hypothetical protein
MYLAGRTLLVACFWRRGTWPGRLAWGLGAGAGAGARFACVLGASCWVGFVWSAER